MYAMTPTAHISTIVSYIFPSRTSGAEKSIYYERESYMLINTRINTRRYNGALNHQNYWL